MRNVGFWAVLQQLPPSVMQEVLADSAFLRRHALSVTCHVQVQDDVAFERSKLYGQVRLVLEGGQDNYFVVDELGQSWTIHVEGNASNRTLPDVILVSEDRRWSFPMAWCFVPDVGCRMHGLDSIVAEINLPESRRSFWSDVFAHGVLDDAEYDEFMRDIGHTPVGFFGDLVQKIRNGGVRRDELVPQSEAYFHRLAGRPSDLKMTQKCLQDHVQELVSWDQNRGASLALLLSSHSWITKHIIFHQFDDVALAELLAWLAAEGDLLSVLGAVEVGLSVVGERPGIADGLKGLVEWLIAESTSDRYRLLSALFMFVEAEMSRLGLLREDPVYHRRISSLAHASLIERALLKAGMPLGLDELCEWLVGAAGRAFHVQAYTDLRLEPLWRPEQIRGERIRDEFIGRLVAAGRANLETIPEGRLREIMVVGGAVSAGDVVGDWRIVSVGVGDAVGARYGTTAGVSETIDAREGVIFEQLHSDEVTMSAQCISEEGGEFRTVESLVSVPYSFMSGPIEGGIEVKATPEYIGAQIERDLTLGGGGERSFRSLLVFAAMFRVSSRHVELAVHLLDVEGGRIVYDEHVLDILAGLAVVASSTRSTVLADRVRDLSGWCRRRGRVTLKEEIVVCLIAAAAYEDLDDWCEVLGAWLSEMAFSNIEMADADDLILTIEELARITPEVWRSCGRAHAALCSVLGR